MAAKASSSWLSFSAHRRILTCGIVGIACGALIGKLFSWTYVPLVFWDSTALLLVSSLWLSLHALDAAATKAHATREDPGRASANAILTVASLISLGAVIALLVQSRDSSGAEQIAQVVLGVVSIVISWAVVHSLYTLRYADLYFKENDGIDFNTEDAPTYLDFAYFAFTIGMTYQVSDTSIASARIRRIALSHALLSYLFGTAIIASTINLVVSLGS